MAKAKHQRKGTIEVNYAACTGCRLCEMACSIFHEGTVWPDASRVRVEQYYPGPLDIPVICHRCFERYCVVSCPTDALSYDAAAEVVRLDASACVQCGACYEACPHTGAIAPHPGTRMPMQCDLCDGQPRCAEACPTGCLAWVEGSSFSPAHYVLRSPAAIARSMAKMYYPAREAAHTGAAVATEEATP
jgi:Fe-S-cluster-containing hydrogenase component 2